MVFRSLQWLDWQAHSARYLSSFFLYLPTVVWICHLSSYIFCENQERLLLVAYDGWDKMTFLGKDEGTWSLWFCGRMLWICGTSQPEPYLQHMLRTLSWTYNGVLPAHILSSLLLKPPLLFYNPRTGPFAAKGAKVPALQHRNQFALDSVEDSVANVRRAQRLLLQPQEGLLLDGGETADGQS